jgi:hypothetical protein
MIGWAHHFVVQAAAGGMQNHGGLQQASFVQGVDGAIRQGTHVAPVPLPEGSALEKLYELPPRWESVSTPRRGTSRLQSFTIRPANFFTTGVPVKLSS